MNCVLLKQNSHEHECWNKRGLINLVQRNLQHFTTQQPSLLMQQTIDTYYQETDTVFNKMLSVMSLPDNFLIGRQNWRVSRGSWRPIKVFKTSFKMILRTRFSFEIVVSLTVSSNWHLFILGYVPSSLLILFLLFNIKLSYQAGGIAKNTRGQYCRSADFNPVLIN